MGETAAPVLQRSRGECGGGGNPPLIRRRKDPASSGRALEQRKRPHGHPESGDYLMLSVIIGSVCLKVRETSEHRDSVAK